MGSVVQNANMNDPSPILEYEHLNETHKVDSTISISNIPSRQGTNMTNKMKEEEDLTMIINEMIEKEEQREKENQDNQNEQPGKRVLRW